LVTSNAAADVDEDKRQREEHECDSDIEQVVHVFGPGIVAAYPLF
jgi:hypothetical protein